MKKNEIGFLQPILKWYVNADGMPIAGGKLKSFADCRWQIKNPAKWHVYLVDASLLSGFSNFIMYLNND